jgi:hypothetical protein
MKSERELEQELDMKINHIININKNFNLRDNDSLSYAILASTIYDSLKSYGLHCLPIRVLYDIDIKLSRIANNQEDWIKIKENKH